VRLSWLLGMLFRRRIPSIGPTVTIRKNCLYSVSLSVGDAFDNLRNSQIMREVHVSTEGTKVLGGAVGFIRLCSRRFRNGLKQVRGLWRTSNGLGNSPSHSHNASYIHQYCNRRFRHFARTDPRGLGRGEAYGDTVVTFLECVDNATLDVAAKILGLSCDILPFEA
jgi:hypothetical protein